MAHLHIGEAAPDYPFGCGSDRMLMLADWDITPERRQYAKGGRGA